MDLAIGEQERRREIIRHAFAEQFLEDREIDRAIGLGKAPANGNSRLVDAHHGALLELLALLSLEVSLRDGGRLARPPQKAPGHDVRMQGVHEYRHAPQGKTATRKPLAKLGQHLIGGLRRARAIGEPGGDGARITVRRLAHPRACPFARKASRIQLRSRPSSAAATAQTMAPHSHFANSSRPISMRLISLVPAPIS